MPQINVGLVGVGVIGGTLKKYLENNNKNCNLLISDPAKGYSDSLDKADVVFISIHIPTEENGAQNLQTLKDIISNLPDKPIFIRTTLLPGTCDALSRQLNKKIYFMPEFLTERTAYEDFCKQALVITGETELLKKIFKDKEHIEMTNIAAEISKYTHNVFGALKVTFFNGIYMLCQKYGAVYSDVVAGALISGYINKTHTFVPGPDGKLGYGGKCFPKDVNAFLNYIDIAKENEHLHKLIEVVKNSNEDYRLK
jgi:UDPglucose 6-dehydrogenase